MTIEEARSLVASQTRFECDSISVAPDPRLSITGIARRSPTPATKRYEIAVGRYRIQFADRPSFTHEFEIRKGETTRVQTPP
jgi:hypothetical protein